MTTKKRTVSVRLDPDEKRRVDAAARLMKQSTGAFLEKAGGERARNVLLAWVVSRYQQGEASLSELAGETGLKVEEIADAVGLSRNEEAAAIFLASCRTVAETTGNPEFLKTAREAVKIVTS